jgi:hypothetical protein
MSISTTLKSGSESRPCWFLKRSLGKRRPPTWLSKQTYLILRDLNNLMGSNIFTKPRARSAATVAYCFQASSILAKSLPRSKTRLEERNETACENQLTCDACNRRCSPGGRNTATQKPFMYADACVGRNPQWSIPQVRRIRPKMLSRHFSRLCLGLD